MRARRGDPLLDIAVELRANGIAGIAGVPKAGIGDDAAEQVLQRLERHHRLGQPFAGVLACREFAELALVTGLKRDAVVVGPHQIGFQFRQIRPAIEIVEVPFRQLAIGRAGGIGAKGSGGLISRIAALTNGRKDSGRHFGPNQPPNDEPKSTAAGRCIAATMRDDHRKRTLSPTCTCSIVELVSR